MVGDVVAPDPPPPVRSVDGAGRRLRLGVTAGVFAVLALGSLIGSDDAYPFGPFRMYATATRPDGAVTTLSVWGAGADERPTEVKPHDLGLRGAELEGQLPRFVEHPELLAQLAEAYGRRYPTRPALRRLWLQKDSTRLRHGHVAGRSFRVVAEWRR